MIRVRVVAGKNTKSAVADNTRINEGIAMSDNPLIFFGAYGESRDSEEAKRTNLAYGLF